MGLFKAFGSWGTRLWEAARATVQPILAALGYAERAEREVAIPDLRREYRKLSRAEGLAVQIAAIAESEYVPLNLYQTPEIPWDKPFSYQVTFYGRDLSTGRYARTDRWLTFSREMEVGEVLDVAAARFSAGPDYEKAPKVRFDIMQMSVTGAELRAGEWS